MRLIGAGGRRAWEIAQAPLGLGAVAALLVLGLQALGAFAAPERLLLDARFTLRGDDGLPTGIVIVALDADSIARLPRFPFSRTIYARLIDRLHAAGAKAIAFDIAFDRPSDRAADAALSSAARRAGDVIFGSAEIDTAGRTPSSPVVGADARIGATLEPVDPDGRVRRIPFAINRLPTLAVRIAQAVGHSLPPRSAFGSRGALIDYRGPAGSIRSVSFYRALANEDVQPLRGAVALIGATAPVLQDVHATPFGILPGVEIQANAADTVLRRLPLRAAAGIWTVFLSLLLGAAGPLTASRTGPLRGLAAGTVAIGLLLIGAQLAFDAGTVLSVTAPTLAGLLGVLGALVVGLGAERRAHEQLRLRFAAGEAPVVAEVLGETEDRQPPDLAPTEIVGGYRIERRIGVGGMGQVFLAEQLSLERQVALKVLLPEHAGVAAYRERFLAESRRAASIEHPHIVPVYDAGEDRGVLFIAMRYIDGVNLAEVLGQLGALEPARAVELVAQVAQALDAAHAAGLVHRDVKPANVLLAGDDLAQALLTDFGVAREARAESRLTEAGEWVGTADYVAPELLSGSPGEPASDRYALGSMLYEMLTGQVPFPADTVAAKLAAHLSAPPPRPGSIVAALAPFDAVVERALAKDPGRRFGSGDELVAAARAALEAVERAES